MKLLFTAFLALSVSVNSFAFDDSEGTALEFYTDENALPDNAIVIDSPEDAQAYIDQLSEAQVENLQQSLAKKRPQCSGAYESWVLGPAIGISIVPILIPVSALYMLVGIPMGFPDLMRGCKDVYDI